MGKWVSLPEDWPLIYNPYQEAFWEAHRGRLCRSCKIEYKCPPNNVCPNCGGRGERKFPRIAIISGRRGGKTRAGAVVGAEEATVPNTIGWACAPTNPKLHRYVIPAFQKLIPNQWVKDYNAEFLDLTLKNDSLIHFQTLEHPDQARGQGLDWLWLDEACELTLEHWEVAEPSLIDRRGLCFITTSPRGYDWVWEKFFHKAEEGVKGYWACKYKSSDNPHISPEELASLRATMTDTMYRQEMEADFVVFENAVYGSMIDSQLLRSIDEVKSVIPEWPEIEKWRQVYVGIDTGADHPFGAVKIVGTEKGLVVVDEYLERDKTFVQHANAIKRMAINTNTIYSINKNERQPMLELAQHGMFCQAADNEQVAGTERVKSWLHTKQLWFVEPKVPKTVKQMQSLRWAPSKSADGQLRREKVFKVNDELPDCIRYVCMTYPHLPTAPPKEEKPLRDVSKFSEEAQGTILRMRRIEGRPPEKESVVGDFYA
jgi:hypothetical protein